MGIFTLTQQDLKRHWVKVEGDPSDDEMHCRENACSTSEQVDRRRARYHHGIPHDLHSAINAIELPEDD